MAERLALIIANSQFNDPKLARLVAPNKDAEILKRVLEDPRIGGFSVTLLIDEPYPEIRREIARLYEGRTRSDLLLLYYSGHGIKDDAGDLYLATKETQTDLISAASIEADFVRARLEKSNSQRKVIILDCCHSGAFMRGDKAKAVIGSSVDTQAAFGGSGYGWGILTASNAIEYAWEDSALPVEARTSVFTHVLVQGLETGAADINHDGEVSLQELYNYVHEQVLTSGRAKQTPLMWQKTEGHIIIAQNPHPVGDVAVALPGELQQAIDSSLAWMRAGAVTELEMLLRSSNARLAHVAREILEKLRNDDSHRVSSAAAAALGRGLSFGEVMPPTPERHPSLGGDLRPSPASIDVGQETTWTFALHNDGDTDLYAVNARHGTTLLIKPFDLKVGEIKQLTFTTSYPTSGRKTEEVVAATTSGEIIVEHTATARVTVRQPKPVLHPGLKLTLSADPQVADTGVEIRWSILLRNSGDDNLRQVVIYFADQQRGEPFDLLAGREKRFTFGRTYNAAGDKSEKVIATGIASDGNSVRDEAQAVVTVRQPARPATSPSPVDNVIREEIKAFARSCDPESIINCPACNCDVTAKNLVRHFDKVHAEDRSVSLENVRRKIKAATSKPSPARTAPAQTAVTPQPPASQTPSQEKLAPANAKTRQQFQAIMQSRQPEELITCPLCSATLQAKNMVWHFDRRHAQNAPEPTLKPVATGTTPQVLIPTTQEYNITKPIVLKLMRVAAGEFLMGSDPLKDKAAQSVEQPQHRVNLPEYYISEYPITNAQYEVFVKATGHDVPEHWKRLLLKPKIPSGTENTPVPNVCWHDAVAFCQWLSKETGKTFRLPTEAEWEKAARGTNGRITFLEPQQSLTDIMSWKRKSDSPYGCMDMMGGNLEWTRSLYCTYPYNANDGRENLRATGPRTVRGQHGFQARLSNKTLRYAERQGYEPATQPYSITFRVVMVPTPEQK